MRHKWEPGGHSLVVGWVCAHCRLRRRFRASLHNLKHVSEEYLIDGVWVRCRRTPPCKGEP